MALTIKNLVATNGTFTLRISSLEVQSGEIISVMGPSGGGKSTLLMTLAGFCPIASGFVNSPAGENLQTVPPELRRMALVFQRPALFPHLNVVENVAFALRVQGRSKKERLELARRWLSRLHIDELEYRMPLQLSGGQAQRVALARAFITGFPVLLLDEPFSVLDPALRSELRKLVVNLVRDTGMSALMVTHDVADAVAISETVAVIDGGALVAHGTIEELRNSCPLAVVRSLFRTNG
jgi:ABC-type Fe3+/spermidine/putrescine transport system ATPase subunit